MEKMYDTFTVEQEVLDKWMPVLEGSGKWESFVSTCPKLNSGDYATVAQMLENTETLKERTDAGPGTGSFTPVLIPMLRRVMPSLIGMQIFGTQPMSGPTGMIFALRASFQNDSNNPMVRGSAAGTGSKIITVASLTDGGSNVATVGGDISFTNDDTVADPTEVGVGKIVAIDTVNKNILLRIVSGAFNVSSGAEVMYATTVTQNQGVVVNALYENEALFKHIFPGYTGSHTTAAGEDLAKDMKEVGFNIETSTITAKTRKLKAKWTEELEQDLQAIHNMNAERLLTSIASDEIVVEMNREFINQINSVAGTTSSWDYNTDSAGETGRWEFEKYQTLMAKISRQKRALAVTNRRGMANFAIVSPGILSVMETAGKLNGEGVDPVQSSYAGKALGMDVYVDIYQENDIALLGYKGPNEIDAGIFYCPYIPLQIKKGYGEEDGQPRTFFHTRYGLGNNLFGAGNYYHKMTVSNLPA
jgi:hypothetical protein